MIVAAVLVMVEETRVSSHGDEKVVFLCLLKELDQRWNFIDIGGRFIHKEPFGIVPRIPTRNETVVLSTKTSRSQHNREVEPS